MSYQVLARSWRPQQFADLLGQDAVVQTLSNALSSDGLGHAYLFSGLRGVGKTTAARLLAKAVNCADGPTAEPCGECVSCREIAEGSSIDVVEIDAATHTGIDQVRELQELLRFRPTRDRYRVVVVDEVHMLSKAAFNALLKSIEEPPDYVLWVFATTERHKVPATILSRCQQLEFRPLSDEAIRAHLENIAAKEGFTLTSGAAATIAAAAQGSVRDALSLVDQLRAFAAGKIDDEAVSEVLGVPPFEVTAGLVGALSEGKVADALAVIRAELAAGHDAAILYQEVGRMLRAHLHLVVDPKLEPALTDGQRGLVEARAGDLGVDVLARMLGLWLEQESMLRDATNRELALEVAALRLARWPAVKRIEQWLATGETPPAGSPPPNHGSSHDRGGPPPGSSARPAGLAQALESEHPRLAGAVEAAQVSVVGTEVILAYAAEARPSARYAASEAVRAVLENACRTAHPGTDAVRIEVEAEAEAGDGTSLTELRAEAEADDGVAAARAVIGGVVVSVRPDGGS
ncbi:MAG: DNA polymerase III subunit gamma/tau [Thermoanaerobaculales bacterium]|nr:DNA polymerase III subunit gamma/tau [Thermoanaerobaculales bacterium]